MIDEKLRQETKIFIEVAACELLINRTDMNETIRNCHEFIVDRLLLTNGFVTMLRACTDILQRCILSNQSKEVRDKIRDVTEAFKLDLNMEFTISSNPLPRKS